MGVTPSGKGHGVNLGAWSARRRADTIDLRRCGRGAPIGCHRVRTLDDLAPLVLHCMGTEGGNRASHSAVLVGAQDDVTNQESGSRSEPSP